ncbi:hypothetical protein PQE20_21475 [Vibrio harveyi]|nr:hypothetical protein [Vibrio harveyi]WCP83979.1 hypothetical protein PQE20_21430 [Vibrio harveyi]WCP83988.1 hypothetical protein PQE20_21475 [Vibrio harveyi]
MALIDSIIAWMDAYEFSLWHLPFWFFLSFVWYVLWDRLIECFNPYP